jgi:hypothetical protein
MRRATCEPFDTSVVSNSMNYSDDFSGTLKQQCLDESGMYEWVRKTFVLCTGKGTLVTYLTANSSSAESNLSLSGAKHAKEWSVSSAIAGYGFDIVWSSGKTWSFLADCESDCKKWLVTFGSVAISFKS